MLNNMSKRTKIILTALLLTILFVDIYVNRYPYWRAQVIRIVLIGVELDGLRR